MSFQPAWVTEGVEARVNENSYRSNFFMPPHAHDVLLHLRFDEDSDTAQDYSGRGRDFTFENTSGGGRTFLPTLAPGGGVEIIGASGSGYQCDTWDGMDYIGDDAGFNSEDLFFFWSGSLPSLAAQLMLGSDEVFSWRLLSNSDGSIEFQIVTSALQYKFTSAASVLDNQKVYSIGFALSDGGREGVFFCGSAGAEASAFATTRAAL